jgi:hypothetical protein
MPVVHLREKQLFLEACARNHEQGEGGCLRPLATKRRGGDEKEETIKHLIILCLSFGLTGYFGVGPYASANGPAYGPIVDLRACARSPEPTTRERQAAVNSG